MRSMSVVAVAAALFAGGMLAVYAENKPAAPVNLPPPPNFPTIAQGVAHQPPASLLGRDVRVYFRGADNISAPFDNGGGLSLALHLDYLAGSVTGVQPGWVSLARQGDADRADVWIPTSSIAFIITDEEPANPTTSPTTQP